MKKTIFSLAAVAVSTVLFVACGSSTGSTASIEGAWVEPNPIDSTQVQGVRLNADGSAESIGMATLVFQGWSQPDDRTLVLTGESIGNGQTISTEDTLTIERLDADSLILTDESGRFEWRLGRQK